MNFTFDDIHVTARIRILLLQLVLQELQVQYDRIDRILDFVRDAARNPPAGRQTPRGLDLVLDASHRLGVPHGEQRADMRSALLDEVQ